MRSFLALLVAATFIDYDLMIIPDQITITGMVVGVGIGTLWPQVRPVPASWAGHHPFPGFLGRGGGPHGRRGLDPVCPQDRRFCVSPRGHGLRRRHPHGNDRRVSRLAGRGPHFFLGPFLGLAHAAWKLLKYVKKRISGGQLSGADREIPYGPYLSMAAATLFFLWKWLWPVCDRGLFNPLYVIFWWMLGINVDLPD